MELLFIVYDNYNNKIILLLLVKRKPTCCLLHIFSVPTDFWRRRRGLLKSVGAEKCATGRSLFRLHFESIWGALKSGQETHPSPSLSLFIFGCQVGSETTGYGYGY